ncbi:MAG: rhodanese-like domain-containing protein [Chloroflexota bacterium]
MRSRRATGVLRDAGFTHVFNLSGGIAAWTAAGLPTKR